MLVGAAATSLAARLPEPAAKPPLGPVLRPRQQGSSKTFVRLCRRLGSWKTAVEKIRRHNREENPPVIESPPRPQPVPGTPRGGGKIQISRGWENVLWVTGRGRGVAVRRPPQPQRSILPT